MSNAKRKTCRKCKKSKNKVGGFYRNKRYADGFDDYCADCKRLSLKAWVLKKEYGLLLDEYEQMYEEQKGLCLICFTPQQTLRVDHDHKTGAIRGLLCNTCNLSLGGFQDDARIIQKAIQYLKTFNRNN